MRLFSTWSVRVQAGETRILKARVVTGDSAEGYWGLIEPPKFLPNGLFVQTKLVPVPNKAKTPVNVVVTRETDRDAVLQPQAVIADLTEPDDITPQSNVDTNPRPMYIVSDMKQGSESSSVATFDLTNSPLPQILNVESSKS